MPRALKTFVTNLGFFELAVAAPSMKAALEAWGMSHNAFQHGFAKQTNDPKIVAAATAKPGVVLKRAIGSSGQFSTDAELPKTLPKISPGTARAPKPKEQKLPKANASRKVKRADVISFEKERAKREKKRAVEEAQVEKTRAARQRATDSAEAALDKARERHEAELAVIEDEQKKLDRRADKERGRWDAERQKLEAAIERARNS